MRFAYSGKNIRPAGPAVEMAGGGKRGKPKAGFLTLPTALGNRKKARFPHSHRRDGDIVLSNFKPKEANPAHSSAPPLRDSILVDVSESRMPSLRTSVLTHTKQRRGGKGSRPFPLYQLSANGTEPLAAPPHPKTCFLQSMTAIEPQTFRYLDQTVHSIPGFL